MDYQCWHIALLLNQALSSASYGCSIKEHCDGNGQETD
mgnify:FL=1